MIAQERKWGKEQDCDKTKRKESIFHYFFLLVGPQYVERYRFRVFLIFCLFSVLLSITHTHTFFPPFKEIEGEDHVHFFLFLSF